MFVTTKLKKCCDNCQEIKTENQGVFCDKPQPQLSNRNPRPNSAHTPLTSPLTPFNRWITECMKPRQSTCVTSINSVKIPEENRNRDNTIQDDALENPRNGENFEN